MIHDVYPPLSEREVSYIQKKIQDFNQTNPN